MNPNQKKIENLKDEIHHLREYLLSDCCRQCLEIVSKIEEHEKELYQLETIYSNNTGE
jgi:hypothetical protein